ncbi:acyl-coenzyme A thioesterase THEM4 isoform X2 [Notothenia coriiceps]|uniref:Acyl-coenzyme A thioesterase THEM4 n=1 Tax=Notothenia coriiceps TaxID=8208 RepID=A0A6I9PEM6_9TELE|nr:PREDICTED: acyl-coenzyme A thioesterase THEM4-like isoform X2 [Notothenia coriiceps]
MARSVGRICKGFQRLGLLSKQTQLVPFTRVPVGTARTIVTLPSFLFPQPRDFSLPNPSWGSEMTRMYEHYESQCEVETEGGQKQKGPWRRLPSYNRLLKYATGGVYLSKMIQSEARLFTRNIRNPGAAFEHVHGGAIATMIDTVTGTHATFLSGPVMTANLNINYRRPIPLGGTVLLESSLEKKEGRKTFITCRVTSTDGSKLHTETSALFLSITASHLLGG